MSARDCSCSWAGAEDGLACCTGLLSRPTNGSGDDQDERTVRGWVEEERCAGRMLNLELGA